MSSCVPGTIICNDAGTQFAICPTVGDLVFQSVAAGTRCSNGQIQQSDIVVNTAGSPGTAAPAVSPETNSTSIVTVTSTQYTTMTTSSSTTSSASDYPSASSSTPTSTPAALPSTLSGASPTYKFFTGNGEPSAGWPDITSWLSFDVLFESNAQTLAQSCAQSNTANNSPQEITEIKAAIQPIAKSTSIDERFILAIMLQESAGCTRVPTTNYGVSNPGLFQSHDGTGSCNKDGQIQTPCPQAEIVQMVRDGVEGTTAGPGLQQLLITTGAASDDNISRFYRAARMYNSGSVAASGRLEDGIATHCYSSDVANRLLGWTAGSNACQLKLALV